MKKKEIINNLVQENDELRRTNDQLLRVNEEIRDELQRFAIMSAMSSMMNKRTARIVEVKYSGPATICFWSDGTKTVAKCLDEDKSKFSREIGLSICIAKKFDKAFKQDIFKFTLDDETKHYIEVFHNLTAPTYKERMSAQKEWEAFGKIDDGKKLQSLKAMIKARGL